VVREDDKPVDMEGGNKGDQEEEEKGQLRPVSVCSPSGMQELTFTFCRNITCVYILQLQ